MPQMRSRLTTVLIAIIVAGTAACSSSGTADPASTGAVQSSSMATSTAAVPAGAVRLGGAVEVPVTLTTAKLKAFAPRTQAVTFQSSKGTQSHTYVGAAMSDVLASAKPTVDASAKNGELTVVVRATGSDGYEAVVSFGELSPDFGATPVLVAYTEDGKPLAAPRLVVPGDIKGGRYVSDLVALDVVDTRRR